jgi:hypothetical protein
VVLCGFKTSVGFYLGLEGVALVDGGGGGVGDSVAAQFCVRDVAGTQDRWSVA